jgi:hypothetical protein
MSPLKEPQQANSTALHITDSPPRKRRWKWIVFLVVIIALPLGWSVYRTHRQVRAERRLKRMGVLTYEQHGPYWYRRLASKYKLPIPERARTFTGLRATDETAKCIGETRSLRRVNLKSGSLLTDTGLRHISKLPNLQMLTLIEAHDAPETAITDEGLRYLGTCRSLGTLSLGRAKVTDLGLAHVRSLTRLRVLCLVDTEITDAGLKYISNLKNLEELALPGAKMTGPGLVHLSDLKNLHRLNLSRTKVTDSALESLHRATSLQTLDLSGTQITDEGLANLAGLVNLKSIDLSQTPITDAALQHFTSLLNLRVLWLEKTEVTEAGVTELKEALLGLRAHCNPRPQKAIEQ